MDLLNATKMVAGYTMGVEPSAREHLVVVVKGTFDLSKDGSPLLVWALCREVLID